MGSRVSSQVSAQTNKWTVSRDCPDIPEEEDFEMYFSAFKEDIEQIDCVEKVTVKERALLIKISSVSNFEELNSNLKILQESYIQLLKVSKLEFVR